MQNLIDSHRETALDSPYSRDREEALEELAGMYPDAEARSKRRIAETYRQVAVESSRRDERDLARERLLDCFDTDPDSIASVVVETLIELATDAKFSDDRLDAIDSLRDVYPDLEEPQRDTVGKTLAEIAGDGTYEDERRRARQRLSDVTHIEQQESGGGDDNEDAAAYLGKSLAEHLENAAQESAEECRKRAEEIQEFMAENPVDDESYEEVKSDVDGLLEALSVVGTDGELAEDRVTRVERIAARVERVYSRN